MEEYLKEVFIGLAGAVGAYLLLWLRRWYSSGDRAKAKAEAVGRASEKRDEAFQRRADDRFVLKETCEECDEKRQIESTALRDFITGVNAAVDALRADTRETRADIREIRNHLMKG